MQVISDENAYDVVCALSWTIHYCETELELHDVIGRCRRAVSSDGRRLLYTQPDETDSDIMLLDNGG
jgi:hypothetical protein